MKLTSFGLIVWPGRTGTVCTWKHLVRKDGVCAYCGDVVEITADHITPASQGGINENNLTAACTKCNQRKKDQKLLAFLIAQGGLRCSDSSRSHGPAIKRVRLSTSGGKVLVPSASMVRFPVLREALQSVLGGAHEGHSATG